MDDWIQWTLKDSFKVQIPADAKTRLDDDGATAVIQMGSGEEVTEVLLSNYPLKNVTTDRTDQAIALRDLAYDFFNRAVRKTLGHEVPFNVDVTEDPEGKLYYAEGVSVLEKGGDRIWLVRMYAQRGDSRFWLIHWNGPKDNLEVVMRIFVSFEPAETSFR
jgi:hypothetical protein